MSMSVADPPSIAVVPASVQSQSGRRARSGGYCPSVSHQGWHRPNPAPRRHAGKCQGLRTRRPPGAAMCAHRCRHHSPAWSVLRCGTGAFAPDGTRSQLQFVWKSSFDPQTAILGLLWHDLMPWRPHMAYNRAQNKRQLSTLKHQIRKQKAICGLLLPDPFQCSEVAARAHCTHRRTQFQRTLRTCADCEFQRAAVRRIWQTCVAL